jgi:hypothetical protein
MAYRENTTSGAKVRGGNAEDRVNTPNGPVQKKKQKKAPKEKYSTGHKQKSMTGY